MYTCTKGIQGCTRKLLPVAALHGTAHTELNAQNYLIKAVE